MRCIVAMYSLKALALAVPFLVSKTHAQQPVSDPEATCSRLEDILKYNSSSTTRAMQAFRLNEARPTTNESGNHARFSIENDTSQTWELSLRVRSGRYHEDEPDSVYYMQTMFLDTGDSNVTDIGSCHQTIDTVLQWGSRWSFQWTREVLERSQEDNGDCTSILSAGCTTALKEQAADPAAQWLLR
jgi:hypothetical protein